MPTPVGHGKPCKSAVGLLTNRNAVSGGRTSPLTLFGASFRLAGTGPHPDAIRQGSRRARRHQSTSHGQPVHGNG